MLLVAAVGGVILGSAVRQRRAAPEVPGPGVAAYLILSVILFATGAFGVLIRRSPLIVLLALEIMLNAGNLALIAFARQTGTGTGADLRADRHGRRRGRGRRRARPHRRGLAAARRARRRQAHHVARMIAAAWIALFAPAVAVVAIALAGTGITRTVAGFLAAGSALVSFACSVVVFAVLLGENPEERAHSSTLWTWLSAGDLKVGAEILVDPLSVFMMLVVSGVGFLILAYAVGYMNGDDEERRYHAYKALFVFSMLLLVQAGNLLLLLAGWGMVGLSSYLLINFWHQRATAVAAGKKAFIMNAFGDATFVLALFLLIQRTGSVDFDVGLLGRDACEHGSTVAVLIALGLLGGAVAKSAQVPLHTWLPDAMEGPTPGLRPHPRGDDGDRRRLPDRAHERPLRARARHPGPRRDPRRGHDPPRRPDRTRPDGHQARHRLLDDEPDRLHVRRRRARRVRRPGSST